MPKAVRGTKETVDSSPLVLESADELLVRSRMKSSLFRSIDGTTTDSHSIYGLAQSSSSIPFNWIPFSTANEKQSSPRESDPLASPKKPTVESSSLETDISKQIQPSAVPVPSDESHGASLSQFPSILSSQSIPSHPSFPTATLPSHSSRKKEVIDWSLVNRDKFPKRSFESTVHKYRSSVPL
ncbi:hypothetical protein WA538_001613, partial [Blastocystis sp. DL]